jgi:putative flippase GtrA
MYATLRRYLEKHAQLVRFVLSGGTATISNLLVVFVLTDLLHVYYLLSSTAAFVTSFSVSFMLQKFWTFNDRKVDVVHKQLAISLSIAGFNLLLNTLFMYVFVEYVGLHYFVAQLLSTALIACETFFMYRHVIFVPDPGFHHARNILR